MNKLLILDGNSLLHRAYYALPDWRNRSGEATAGVYGFLSMLLKAVSELKPTHLVTVFDCPEPTFRHLLYVGYQVTREKDRQVSEDIWGQVDKLKIVLEKMAIPAFAIPGFEADDVIGTLCQKLKNSKTQIVIVTGDRDMMQLVNKHISLYMPSRGVTDATLVGEAEVKARLGINPDQVIDYKGLVGDSSDNYPGVAGIGPKTAVSLLEEFGSIDRIYKSLAKIKETLRQKLAAGYEAAILSQKLATIKTDVPLTLDWSSCVVPTPEAMTEVFKQLGHKSLIKRIGGKLDEDSARPRLFE